MTVNEMAEEPRAMGSADVNPETPSNRVPFWILSIVAIASLLPVAWAFESARFRLMQPHPQSPWESAILVDAWRAHHGLPVYTLPTVDHATHMYGPLITYAVAPFMNSPSFSLRPP